MAPTSAATSSRTRSSAPASTRREVEDVILGCALPERATGGNIARQAALRAGLPVTVAGMTVNRFCSSGLQTIALAAQRIIAGEASVIAAGGLESISLVQDGKTPPAHERMDAGAQARPLHADDRHRRQRRRALQGQPRSAGRLRARKPAPHRDGAAGQALRRARSCRCRPPRSSWTRTPRPKASSR